MGEWDGRPQHPERPGAHAMQHIATGNIEVKLWTPHARLDDQWCWIDECGDDIISDTVGKHWRYIGPCLLPSEIAAREAAAEKRGIERAAAWHDVFELALSGPTADGESATAGAIRSIEAHWHSRAAAAIRALLEDRAAQEDTR